MGVIIERAGFGSDGGWTWRLPIDDQTCPTPPLTTNPTINDDETTTFGRNGAGSPIDGHFATPARGAATDGQTNLGEAAG